MASDRAVVDGIYGYDPVTFQFDHESVQQRWAEFRRNAPLQPLGFWAVLVLFYVVVGFIVQWRGLNGSMGWVWQVQHIAVLGGGVLWKLVAVCEYRRGWVETACRAVVGADTDIRLLTSRIRAALIYAHVLVAQVAQCAAVLRHRTQCTEADMKNIFDIMYCSSSIQEVPYDGFFSMVILGMVYHWIYLYILPWSVPVCTYVMGGVWTLMIVVDKRLHLETLTVQQQNSHVMVICGYVAVFLSHYVMQNVAMSEFIAVDRAAQFLLEQESLSDPLAPSRSRVSQASVSRDPSQQPPTHISAAAATAVAPLLSLSREDKDDDEDDTISISTVSTLTLPANRRHAPRDDRLVDPTRRPSASTQAVSSAPRSVAAAVLPRAIVEERALSLCEGDDDDHVASYDDVDPPSASTPTGVVLRTIMEERALSLCEGDDDHIASYDDIDPLPAIRR